MVYLGERIMETPKQETPVNDNQKQLEYLMKQLTPEEQRVFLRYSHCQALIVTAMRSEVAAAQAMLPAAILALAMSLNPPKEENSPPKPKSSMFRRNSR